MPNLKGQAPSDEWTKASEKFTDRVTKLSIQNNITMLYEHHLRPHDCDINDFHKAFV